MAKKTVFTYSPVQEFEENTKKVILRGDSGKGEKEPSVRKPEPMGPKTPEMLKKSGGDSTKKIQTPTEHIKERYFQFEDLRDLGNISKQEEIVNDTISFYSSGKSVNDLTPRQRTRVGIGIDMINSMYTRVGQAKEICAGFYKLTDEKLSATKNKWIEKSKEGTYADRYVAGYVLGEIENVQTERRKKLADEKGRVAIEAFMRVLPDNGKMFGMKSVDEFKKEYNKRREKDLSLPEWGSYDFYVDLAYELRPYVEVRDDDFHWRDATIGINDPRVSGKRKYIDAYLSILNVVGILGHEGLYFNKDGSVNIAAGHKQAKTEDELYGAAYNALGWKASHLGMFEEAGLLNEDGKIAYAQYDDVRAPAEIAEDVHKAYQYYDKYKDKSYDDNFLGWVSGGWRQGDIGLKRGDAGKTLYDYKSADTEAADVYDLLSEKIVKNSGATFDEGNWFKNSTLDVARYAPQGIRQAVSYGTGYAVGAFFSVGNTKVASVVGNLFSSADMYGQTAGQAYLESLKSGLSVEDAYIMARNEAAWSAGIEFGIGCLFDMVGGKVANKIFKTTLDPLNPGKLTSVLMKAGMSHQGANKVMDAAYKTAKFIFGNFGEGTEEFLQEGLSITAQRYAKEGRAVSATELLRGCFDFSEYTDEDFSRMKDSFKTGFVVGTFTTAVRSMGDSVTGQSKIEAAQRALKNTDAEYFGNAILGMKESDVLLQRAVAIGKESKNRGTSKLANDVDAALMRGESISAEKAGRLTKRLLLDGQNVLAISNGESTRGDEVYYQVEDSGNDADNDVVFYSTDSNDAENKSIKKQIREKMGDIMLSPAVANVEYDNKTVKTARKMKDEVIRTLDERGRSTDSKVVREGFGVVDMSYQRLKDGLKYMNTAREIYSLPHAADVVKYGIQVYYEDNHKTTGNESFTFAAPVNINGVPHAMGVVVQRSGVTGGNKYHVHRVILPDGSSLVLDEKKQRLLSGSVFQENERPVSPITAVSDAIISQDGEKNNKNMKKVYPGLTAADVEMGNIPENLRVRLENYKKVVAQMGYTVIYEPNRSVPKGTIGYVDITNREVYLSPEYLSEALLAHELTHVIDRGYGGKYIKDLVSFFKKNLRDDWDKAEARVRETYKDIPGASIEAETLADMCTKFTTDEYIKKAASMEVGTIKQIAVFCKYVGARLNSIFLDKSNAQKFKVASLKWQMALYKATKKGAVTDSALSGTFYGLVGRRKDGIEVYETSEETKSKPYKERRKAFLEIMSNEYRGRTARFVKNGKKYYATFDEADVQKNIYGDEKSDPKGRDAKLNVGADGAIFDLVENSKYITSENEIGKSTKPHKDVVDWDYYEKTVQIDDVVFDVYINVRNKTADSFVYSVHLRENKKIKAASPHRSTKKASVKSGDSHLYDISISQDGAKDNKNLSTNDDMLMAVSDGETADGGSAVAEDGTNDVKDTVDTSAIEEEISIIDEALKDESLPSADRVALIKEKVRLQRELSGGRDAVGKEDSARTKKLEDAVDAYRESGDTSGIPTRQSVAASKKYYGAKISDIEAEMKQVYEALRNKEYLSDMEYDELCNRYDALRTQWREAAKKNSVLAEVSDILDEIDTAARPNHTWVRDIAGWLDDKKNLIKYGTYNLNDIERNFKIFFGKHFKTAYDKIIQPLYDSKKAYVFGVTEYADRLKKEIVDGLGIKKGSKESAAVMWLGEGQKPQSSKAGSDLAPYTYRDCVAEFGEDAAKKIQKATEIFREMYDELLDQVNETRAMLYPNNPDKLIPRRSDYFRHFQEMSQGFEGLKNILQTNIGIDPMLVGVSENTKPKSKFQSFAQSRTGNSTTYDAVGGFLDYLPAAQYSIHIDPNIVNVRSLAYDLASAKAAENNGNGNPNANGFIAYLQRYANSLAGKTTSHFDRAIQDSNFGRTAMAVVSWLNNKTKASAVLGNMNSVLAQVTNLKNVIGKIEHQSDIVQGAVDALAGLNPDGRVAARYNDSGFLKERYLDRVFSQFDRGWDKVNPVKWAADLLGFADEIGTRITWNAAYNEAVRKNVENPVQYADNFTRACVAGRGIGEEALVFKSQVAKMFLPFRTEVLNDLRVQQDILFGTNDEGNSPKVIKRVKNIMQLYVASMVINAVIAAVKSDEFEPLEEAKEGYEENGLLGALMSVMEDYADGTGNPVAFDPIYDIATGIYQGATEGESAGGKVGRSAQRTVQNLAGDLVSNNPFSTAVMGMIGFDNDASELLFNGNVYVPGGMGMPLAGSVTNVMRELGQGDYASAAAATVKPFLPMGTQIDRSAKGIYDWTQGYATTEAAYDRMAGQEGSLKYLIEKTPETFIKSLLFGPGAYARESSTYKLNEDQTKEVLKEKDYQGRKTLFDEIIEWKQYDDGREDILEKRALEYYGEDEDSVLGKLLRYTDDKGKEKRRDNVVPYGRFKQAISITLDDRKFNGIISVEKAEEMNAIMGERLEYWYDMLNESAEFSRLDDERKESIVNSIYNIESDYMVVQELYRQGVVPDYEYNNYGYDYVIKCAGKMSEIDASVMRQYADDALEEYVIDRDNAEKFAEYNAANTAAMFIKNAYFMDDDIKSEVQRYYQTESAREPDAVDKEIARLSYETRDKMYVYGDPYGVISYTKNGVKYALQIPAEEIYGIFESADTQVRRNLEKLMKGRDYINASDEDKKEMVESVRNSVRSTLRKRYKAMYPSIKVENAYDRTVDDSVDDKISEYYDENSDKDNIDAEVERVGKSTKDRIRLQADADDIFVFTDKSFEYSIQVPSDDVYGIFSDYNTQVRSGLSSLLKESRYIDASDIVKRKMIVSVRDQVRKRIRDSIKNMYPSVKVRTLFDRIVAMK